MSPLGKKVEWYHHLSILMTSSKFVSGLLNTHQSHLQVNGITNDHHVQP